MKITIYDLIKLIKEDKAPKKIKCYDNIWEYKERVQDYTYKTNGMTEKYFIQDKFRGYDATKEILNFKIEIIEEETENAFTGCKWFVRGKETMSMEYEDSENWFKAKELIESLSSVEKTEEEKDIEEINEIIRFQDLATPYGHNEQMFMKFLIIHQNKIDELVKKVNKLKNRKEEK